MSFKQYKSLDLFIFSLIAIIFEFANYKLYESFDSFHLLFLSYSTVISLICVYRWGLIGFIPVFVGGLAACIATSSYDIELLLAYCVSSSLGVLISALIFQYGLKRKRLQNKILLITYFTFTFITVLVLRAATVAMFSEKGFLIEFTDSIKNSIIIESMSYVVSIIVLLIAARKNGNILIEMVGYIKDVQDEEKLGGLKKIKESPKFNFDNPLTEPDEMDEAYILDGGQLNNKQLKELEENMDMEVDEDEDPMSILTTDSKKEE